MFFKRINNNISLLMHKVQNYSLSCGYAKGNTPFFKEGRGDFQEQIPRKLAPMPLRGVDAVGL